MTITLTKEELHSFQLNLEDWYNKRSLHIIKEVGNKMPFTRPEEALPTAVKSFEKENPKPDWRTLL